MQFDEFPGINGEDEIAFGMVRFFGLAEICPTQKPQRPFNGAHLSPDALMQGADLFLNVMEASGIGAGAHFQRKGIDFEIGRTPQDSG